MDDKQFDAISRGLVSMQTRRSAIKTLFGAAIGTAAFAGLASAASAIKMNNDYQRGRNCQTCCKPRQQNCARIRLLHLSPDAPAVDIWIGNDRVATGVKYGEYSPFIGLAPSSVRISIVPSGSLLGSAVLRATVKLSQRTWYEVAVVGTLASLKVKAYKIDKSALAAGKARVRVIHASPGSPAVDVVVTAGPTLIENLAFPDASAYLTVDAGDYPLQVLANSNKALVLDLGTVSFAAGGIYDVFAIGADPGSLSVLPLTV